MSEPATKEKVEAEDDSIERHEIRLIEPLIAATAETISSQCSVDVNPGSPFKKGAGSETDKDIVALFGVMGERAGAVGVVCFSE